MIYWIKKQPFALGLSPFTSKKEIKFGKLINIPLSLKQYLVAIPRSLPPQKVLIYKEAARDQAQ